MEAHHGKAELFLHCQCCMRGVTFTDAKGSSDLFGNDDSSQIIDPSYNASCFHNISFSFYDTFGGRSQTAPTDPIGHFVGADCVRPPSIILQITRVVSVKGRRFYRRIYFLILPRKHMQAGFLVLGKGIRSVQRWRSWCRHIRCKHRPEPSRWASRISALPWALRSQQPSAGRDSAPRAGSP